MPEQSHQSAVLALQVSGGVFGKAALHKLLITEVILIKKNNNNKKIIIIILPETLQISFNSQPRGTFKMSNLIAEHTLI